MKPVAEFQRNPSGVGEVRPFKTVALIELVAPVRRVQSGQRFATVNHGTIDRGSPLEGGTRPWR